MNRPNLQSGWQRGGCFSGHISARQIYDPTKTASNLLSIYSGWRVFMCGLLGLLTWRHVWLYKSYGSEIVSLQFYCRLYIPSPFIERTLHVIILRWVVVKWWLEFVDIIEGTTDIYWHLRLQFYQKIEAVFKKQLVFGYWINNFYPHCWYRKCFRYFRAQGLVISILLDANLRWGCLNLSSPWLECGRSQTSMR